MFVVCGKAHKISISKTGSTQFQGVFVRGKKVITVIILSTVTDRPLQKSVDPDQTPQSRPLLRVCIVCHTETSRGRRMDYFKFSDKYSK